MPNIVNRTGGSVNLTILGRNTKTNEVDIYQTMITTGEPITLSADPLSSGNFDYQTIMGRNGEIIGQVQLDEQEPAGEVSVSFYEDFDYLGKTHVHGNSKNRLINLLSGEAFELDSGERIIPIGTNGTLKTKTSRAKQNEMNLPFKMVYYNEGGFIKINGTADPVTGRPYMKANPYEKTFNTSHKTFSLEVMTSSGAGQVNRMFPVLAKNTLEWAEGDVNQFNLTAQRGCDMFERNEFFTDIFKEAIPEGEEALDEFFVDYIIKNGATEPAQPAEGLLSALLGADGTVSFKKSNGAKAWVEEAELKKRLKAGTRIKSNQLIEKTSEVKKVNTFAVVSMDGTHLVDFTTDSKKRFYCTVKDYNTDVANFVDYVTE